MVLATWNLEFHPSMRNTQFHPCGIASSTHKETASSSYEEHGVAHQECITDVVRNKMMLLALLPVVSAASVVVMRASLAVVCLTLPMDNTWAVPQTHTHQQAACH
jgi:hypothetical protein